MTVYRRGHWLGIPINGEPVEAPDIIVERPVSDRWSFSSGPDVTGVVPHLDV